MFRNSVLRNVGIAKLILVWGITVTLMALIFLAGCGWGGGGGGVTEQLGVNGSPSPARGPITVVTVPANMEPLGEYTWTARWISGVSPYTIAWDFGGGAANIPAAPATSPTVVSVVMDGREGVFNYTVTLTDGPGNSETASGIYSIGEIGISMPYWEPVIEDVTVEDGTVTVEVSHPVDDLVTVSVSNIPGMTVDPREVEVQGSGTAVFQFVANQDYIGASGTTRITARERTGGYASREVTVSAYIPEGFVIFAEYDRQLKVLTLNMDFSESEMVKIRFSDLRWVEVPGGYIQDLPGGWTSKTFLVDLLENEENFGTLRVTAWEVIDQPEPDQVFTEYKARVYIERPVYVSSLGYDFFSEQISVEIEAVESATVGISTSLANGIQSSQFTQDPDNPNRFTSLVDYSGAAKAFGYGDVTVSDQYNNSDTEQVWLQHESVGIIDDRIYAIFDKERVGVEEEVLITVTTGELSHSFQFMLGVGLVLDGDAEYVARSFNIGSPGGTINFLDGIWALVDPPGFIFGPDMLIQSGPDPDGSLESRNRFDFNISPLYGHDIIGGNGDLFNLRVKYSEPGVKTLTFQQTNGVNRTYYSDLGESSDRFWDDCSNWHPGLQTSIIVE